VVAFARALVVGLWVGPPALWLIFDAFVGLLPTLVWSAPPALGWVVGWPVSADADFCKGSSSEEAKSSSGSSSAVPSMMG